ncbi:MAG: flagellar basal body rod protein FlgB [Candidatus Gastranaerophilales bacterium]|nr:flagellar basal body rod protein FlgB [Candidatus Gastranaerophilales bacterium]
MDLINNRTKEIAAMALDGLHERSKAISANTVNVLTPGYQRKEVSFEKSLRDIIQRENEKEDIKIQNSIMYQQNPKTVLMGQSPEQIAFLNTQVSQDYLIDVTTDNSDANGLDGNNVNLESEMMDEAKNGMQYQVVASLLSKSYAHLNMVIKGQNQ